MKTTLEQFQKLLLEPEGTTYEFKEAKVNYEIEKVKEYCVALANEGGGKIILGVTDKRPRIVVGTKAFAEPGRTQAILYQHLHHHVSIEEISFQDKRILIFHVPSSLPGRPWHVKGRYLKRAGDDLCAISPDELSIMFKEGGLDFSAEICPKATIADLDENAVLDFGRRWSIKSQNKKIQTWKTGEILENAELTSQNQVTFAALILFGKRESLGRLLAQSEIIFEYRSSEAAGPAAERQEYREGFFLIYDILWQKINLRNDRQSYQDGLFRIEIPTFDEISVREALLNAIAHRDYSLSGSVFIRQYSQRLEIVSPGGFPIGITPDNILEQQNPRNRRLAEALGKCGLIERSGQGVNLMFESAIKQGKALPDFNRTSVHEVRLLLEGAVQNPAFAKFIELLGPDRLRNFSSYDFLALDYIRRDKHLPDHLKAIMPNLVDIGAVESIGRGRGTRYILSQSLYSALGAKGVHTRKKGLDHETNKALLNSHLLSQAKTGSPFSELRQVLPSLNDSALKRMLNELKAEGSVSVLGQRRWARWYGIKTK